ncbi:hypothetical protein [Streptomonospora salina]|uniref:Uncharacterized protein n=1 Tax=Streptomonospora salina TaxID=104205 RepID=A0A841E8U7_9ACTN|nr:hypothetical protein [Streptomonospora salina]MBB5997739.1 hypothetical protein [Streptomonospora salina]
MIIWRGWGILTVLIAAACCIPAGLIVESALGSELAPFGVAFGLVASGIAVFFLGQRLNTPRPGFHPQTGERVVFRNRHTLFFVPMQYCGFVLLGAAVLVTVMSLLSVLSLI